MSLAPSRMSVRAPVRQTFTGAGRVAARAHSAHHARHVVSTGRHLKLSIRSETAVEQPSARKQGLALMLDDGTRKSHSIAENTAFVTGFFKGIAQKDTFARLVASLYFIYKAMEDAFDSCTEPEVRKMDYAQLRRVRSLEADMEYFYGTDWQTKVKPSPATRAYVSRINEVARENPYLLIAHQYTRYLGDLFGGQMMGGMATKSLKLEDNQGISFYSFDDIPDVKDFIEEWYTGLNELPLSSEQKQAIVDEGNLVFKLNIEVFDELEGNAALPVLKLLWSSLLEKLGVAQ